MASILFDLGITSAGVSSGSSQTASGMAARSIKDVLIKFIISVVFGLNGPLSRRQSLVHVNVLEGTHLAEQHGHPIRLSLP